MINVLLESKLLNSLRLFNALKLFNGNGLKLFNSLKLFKALFLVFLCVSVSACGFHLRGTSSLQEVDKIVFLEAPRGSFEQQLEDDLRISGVQLTNEKEASDWYIKVSQARSGRDIGTLNERGTVDSYKLRMVVTYSVFGPDNKLLRSPQTLTESRQYVFNPAGIIESEFEEEALRNGMEKEISLRIIRHLSELQGS